jgi:hypothetical protein
VEAFVVNIKDAAKPGDHQLRVQQQQQASCSSYSGSSSSSMVHCKWAVFFTPAHITRGGYGQPAADVSADSTSHLTLAASACLLLVICP